MADTVEPEAGQPITFADLGLPTTPTTTDSCFGKMRYYSDLEKKEIVFLTISMISILATIGLTIERIIVVDSGTSDFTFALLLLIHSVFILYYILDGVFRERPFELAVFVIGVFIIIIYCITNFVGTDRKESVVKLVRLVLIAVLGIPDIILGCILTKQYYLSRNLIFRTVGANAELQDMCSLMYFCEALLKFDFQLEVSIFVLVLSEGTSNVKDYEYVLLFLGLAYGFIWNIMGYLAMRFENKPLVWIFLATSVIGPAYIVYKLVDVVQDWSITENKYISIVIIICSAAALVVRVVLVVTMVKVYQNFGKGLKEKAFGSKDHKPLVQSESQTTRYGSTDSDSPSKA